MSYQAQALTMNASCPAEVGYVRPQFRVVEGGLSSRKGDTYKSDDCKRAQHLNGSRKVVASGQRALPMRVYRAAVMMAACALTVFALAWWMSDALMAQAHDAAFSGLSNETIVVHTGDSLWTIADQHPVDGRTTEEVARYIRESNDLDSSCLYAGMELSVPRQAHA